MLSNQVSQKTDGGIGGTAAFRFTLKIKHCYTAAELRALFPDYCKLVAKGNGTDDAETMLV